MKTQNQGAIQEEIMSTKVAKMVTMKDVMKPSSNQDTYKLDKVMEMF